MAGSLEHANLPAQLLALRLVTPSQLKECQRELGEDRSPESLLRTLERKAYLTSLQIDKIRKGDRDGYFLGGYRLLYKIASGSFGRVYRGDDPDTGRVVAIKVLRRRWTDNPESVQLFEREARVGMSLRHPGIVEILAVGRDASTGQYYIVMEFVEGGNLRDLLALRKNFDPAMALSFIEDMASALSYAFAHGVTHRDLKLTNILISTQGQAKLVDFGLARMYKGSTGFGRAEDNEHVQRTVDYAGLEKTTGVTSGDIRSDIYFLGVVAYEMLTGRPPVALSRDKHSRMHRQRFTSVAPLKPEEVGGHTAVVRLIETMMAYDPQQRFQTPAQLLEAVREARVQVAGDPTAAASTKNANAQASQPTVFVVEADERLQNVLRVKLKELGYRVLIAADPIRAVERFNRQGFGALVVDAATTADEGLRVFKHILNEAHEKRINCHGILILGENQGRFADPDEWIGSVTVLSRPLRLKQLTKKLCELVPVGNSRDDGD